MQNDPGVRFAHALAAKDFPAVAATLSDDVDFRGLTPGAHWDAAGPDEVIDVLQEWFEPNDDIKRLLGVSTARVQDRSRVTYRVEVQTPDGRYEVEQQMYYEHDGDRITMMRVMCSGFREIP